MKKENHLIKPCYITLYIALASSLAFFILILIDVKNGGISSSTDVKFNAAARYFQIPMVLSFSKIITNMFEPVMFIILSIILIWYLFYKRRNLEAIFLIVILIIAQSLVAIVKNLAQRARPENILVSESTYSFPSSHALMAVVFFGAVVYTLLHGHKTNKSRYAIIVVGILAIFLMGLTRVVLNAHWLSDVLAGYSLGIFLLASYLLLNKCCK